MAVAAVRVLRRLEGLFCVYKPSGVPWKMVRDTIETKLLKEVNAVPREPCPQQVRFLPEPGTEAPGGQLTLTVASVPALASHPLVTGPKFRHIKVGVGHVLDTSSSGVLVLGVGRGNKALNDFFQTKVTRDYTLECVLGSATQDFSDTGRLVERSTYGHITLDKLNKVLAMLQGANQKALLTYTNVDMSSQEAYEMAAQGKLGPEGKSEPILTGLRCIRFQPPNFTLEVQCINETQQYLRKVVHEIGLELRSTAVCSGVRRTRDGPFALQHALIRQHWTASDVMRAIQQHQPSKKDKTQIGSRMTKAGSQRPEENATVSLRHEGSEKTAAATSE